LVDKTASGETDGAPFVGTDVVRISRFNGSIWENFRVTGSDVETFIDAAGAAAAAVAAHEGAGDPHPQYLTAAEGAAAFQPLDADLTAIAALAGTGIAVRSAADTWVQRLIAGTANEITVTNGDGVAGNPTISIPTAVTFTGKTIEQGTYNSATFTGTMTLPGTAHTLDSNGLGLGVTASVNLPIRIQKTTNTDLRIQVANLSTGTAAGTRIDLQGESTSGATLQHFGVNNTTGAAYELANGALVKGTGAGGMTVAATHASGLIYFVLGSTYRGRITTTGWAIGSAAPATSAALDIQGTDGALLLPRLTTTQRDALTPSDGMEIYNSTLATVQVRNAGAWVSVPGAGAPGTFTVTQVEVDFGTTPVESATFTITDAGMTTAKHVIASLAYEAPTGKDLDELEMDTLSIVCGNGTGQFDMFIRSTDGSYLADKFKINYSYA
jgi:hypothetical protein